MSIGSNFLAADSLVEDGKQSHLTADFCLKENWNGLE